MHNLLYIHCGASSQSQYFVEHFWHVPLAVGLMQQLLRSQIGIWNFHKKENKSETYLLKGRPTLYVQYTWSWLSPPCASARVASASGWGTLSKMSLVEEDEEDPVPKAALRGPLQSTPVSHLNNKAHLWVVPTSPLFTYRQYSASCLLWQRTTDSLVLTGISGETTIQVYLTRCMEE